MSAVRSTQDHLDFGFLEEALIRWASHYSNVLAFETRDPVRARQVKAFLVARFEGAEIYLFNRWEGLLRWQGGTRGAFQPVTRGARGAYDALITEAVSQGYRELAEALQYLDARLQSTQTIAILEHLEGFRSDLKEQRLLDALRLWAHHPELTLRGSMVVLISGDLGQVVDELTTQRIILSRPPLASPEERAQVLNHVAQTLGIDVSPEERRVIVEGTRGLNLHQLGSVLREAWELGERKRLDLGRIQGLKAKVLNQLGFLELEEPSFGFDSIGGYEAVKELIRARIIRPLRDRERAERFGLSHARGVLLFGPPGTGKTVLARALAKELDIPFINLRLENLFAPELGRSGQLFEQAISLVEQMAPCLVFIDEIDRFSRRYAVHDSAGEETRRVFNQVLTWLGSKERAAILVGTTNMPQDLDPALLRPGRIDCLIPVLYPGWEARRQIIAVHLGLVGPGPRLPALALSDEETQELLDLLAAHTRGMSGAELEELVRRAKVRAYLNGGEHITKEDFLAAAAGFRIDTDRRAREQEEYLNWWVSQCSAPLDLELVQALRAESDLEVPAKAESRPPSQELRTLDATMAIVFTLGGAQVRRQHD